MCGYQKLGAKYQLNEIFLTMYDIDIYQVYNYQKTGPWLGLRLELAFCLKICFVNLVFQIHKPRVDLTYWDIYTDICRFRKK